MSAPKDQKSPSVCPYCRLADAGTLWGESVELFGWICNNCKHIVYAERKT
jgi:RNA polymerase subunit RPABC4/transcription elongation factor Spt4